MEKYQFFSMESLSTSGTHFQLFIVPNAMCPAGRDDWRIHEVYICFWIRKRDSGTHGFSSNTIYRKLFRSDSCKCNFETFSYWSARVQILLRLTGLFGTRNEKLRYDRGKYEWIKPWQILPMCSITVLGIFLINESRLLSESCIPCHLDDLYHQKNLICYSLEPGFLGKHSISCVCDT